MIDISRPADAPALDERLDAQLQRLLADLRLLVPCDAAAAWFALGDRRVLRAVLPREALLPPDAESRQAIFAATAEAARVGDLSAMDDAGGRWRSWLGVPLLVGGRRRGWIEAFSLHPDRFSEDDLQRAEVLARYAAEALAHLEQSLATRRDQAHRRALMEAVTSALRSADARLALPLLIERMASLDTAITAAALLLPAERAYALGLTEGATEAQAHPGGALVSVVARWQAPQSAGDRAPATSVLLPLRHDVRVLGWLSLRASTALPPHQMRWFQEMGVALSALLVWLEEQAQREAQAQRAARVLLQQTRQLRLLALMDLTHLLRPLVDAAMAAVTAAGEQPQERALPSLARAQSLLAMLDDPEARTPRPLRLADIVAEAVDAVRAAAEAGGVMLQLLLPDSSPIVTGRRAHLWLACLELLQNALDAVADAAAPAITVEVAVAERTAMIRVRDNGCGIPPASHERVFAPGYTTKASDGAGPRLGLGLALAREIAHTHHGSLTVESDVWQGSTFCLLLPLV